MSIPTAQSRKPSHSPYSSLHIDVEEPPSAAAPFSAERVVRPEEARSLGELNRGQPAIAAGETVSLSAEVERLESLKSALFGALMSSPSAALPLVDLATTYSNLLKLQLTLLPSVKAPSARGEARARREPEPLKR